MTKVVLMGEWISIEGSEIRDPDLDPWRIEVFLSEASDGSLIPTGLRIEPRNDYDGYLREQRITLERLRRFPIGYVTQAAIYLRAASALPESSDDGPFSMSLDDLDPADLSWPVIKKRISSDPTLSEDSRKRWEVFALGIDTLNERINGWDDENERIVSAAAAAHDAEARRVYAEQGCSRHEINIRRAADYYREAQKRPGVTSIRRYVSEAMDVSRTSVDRWLREARSIGYLEPYDGPQGKHGKPTSEGGSSHE